MSWLDFFRFRRRQKPRDFRKIEGDRSTLPVIAQSQDVRTGRTRTVQFPRFWSTAGDQTDRRRLDTYVGVRMRLRDAFTPSQPVVDRRAFAGRREILSSLIRAIEELRQHVVLYSGRGFGKTSLMYVAAQAAREARYVVAQVSCGAGSDFDEVFRAIARQIPLLYHSSVDPASADAEKGRTLADILPESAISPRIASDALGHIVRTRVLIMLDEFDRCESDDFRRCIAEVMKNLSDQSARVLFVIAGVADNLRDLIAYVPSVQRNIFALQLPPMSQEEVAQLIANGEELTGLRFDDAAANSIIEVSKGFPFLVSLLCHRAGLHALDEERLSVNKEDVQAAIAIALQELEARISTESPGEVTDLLRNAQGNYLSDATGGSRGQRLNLPRLVEKK